MDGGHPGFVFQRAPPAQAAPPRVPLLDRRRHPGGLPCSRSPARPWWISGPAAASSR
ncbi:MAG: hypothetical protein MZV70_62990 [Desulfobacterales bacterium]|nr:hypothetical protein [Desulfobacterales bacterium]